MEKLKRKASLFETIKRIVFYFDNRYDRLQKDEIVLGEDKGLDTYFYKNHDFDWKQMREIRLGLEKGLDVSAYAKGEFNVEQMEEIRIGLEKGLDVSFYSKHNFDWKQMREIRLGLGKELDVSTFAKNELNIEQMEEIKLGLEKGLDVSFYNKPGFDWRRMREIRLGLERGLDVSTYAKEQFSVEKMEKMRIKQQVEKPMIEVKKEPTEKQAPKSKQEEKLKQEKTEESNEESNENNEKDRKKEKVQEEFKFSRYDANVIIPTVRKFSSREQLEKLFQQRYKDSKEADKQSNIFLGRLKKLVNNDYIEEQNDKYKVTVKGAKAAKEMDKTFEFTPYDSNVVFGHIKAANGLLSLGNLYSQLEEKYAKPEDVEEQFKYLKNRLESNFKCGYVLKNDKGAYSISEIGAMKAEEASKTIEVSIEEELEY
ncbi:hypothetical protein [Proteiniborus sp. MB09-C3]|uniref:hypothetical protein n=1 Tax=Proteiniborus sp. MB09-C3 TaxID=3050072 RepID=UPI0025573576|nr:hypothetical protein [Proteiniborus sp. MB09-C3]WIV11119.1 hypothetical protein QO263_13300 [Proteiniborus sp. MB09-C3]